MRMVVCSLLLSRSALPGCGRCFFLDVFKSRQDISGVGFIWGAENGAFEREFCYGLLLVGMDWILWCVGVYWFVSLIRMEWMMKTYDWSMVVYYSNCRSWCFLKRLCLAPYVWCFSCFAGGCGCWHTEQTGCFSNLRFKQGMCNWCKFHVFWTIV